MFFIAALHRCHKEATRHDNVIKEPANCRVKLHKDSRRRKSLISKAQLDEAKGDLDKKLFFQSIAQTNLRLDVVLCEEAYESERATYIELPEYCNQGDWLTWLLPIECTICVPTKADYLENEQSIRAARRYNLEVIPVDQARNMYDGGYIC
ncbi:hypothetical protein DPMN_029909 [Dreissena polymorpha]|uniref:Uncharacterized protein n=1 Tax=Dreissena polymorpha TaxID=45954 RepID=A0A9D4RFQ1_DREPO|nr:hypothetical protein DPMN_029909 [Dreissena polymorpha]